MPKKTNTISKHIFSILATIVLITIFSCASIYIYLKSTGDGPYSDMAGIGFAIFFCGFTFLLFFLLVLIGVVSEFGKKVFQDKLNQWASTILMFVVFTGTSLLILFLLETFVVHDKFSIFWWFTPVLDTSIKIGIIGVVYWLIFTNLDNIAAKID